LTKELFREQKNMVRISLEEMHSRVKALISKYKDLKNENSLLKENIKNLNLKISELKLQNTKAGTELINKDKEISELKNLALNSSTGSLTSPDKDNVRSRIKELISRIDTHLEHYEENDDRFDDR
jgi:chromosome segregation ATPase